MIISFSLIVFFQIMLSNYSEKYSIDKVNSSLESTFEIINTEFNEEVIKAVNISQILIAENKLNSGYISENSIVPYLYLFDWEMVDKILVINQGRFLSITKHEMITGDTMNLAVQTLDFEKNNGFNIINGSIIYHRLDNKNDGVIVFFQKGFLANYLPDDFKLMHYELKNNESINNVETYPIVNIDSRIIQGTYFIGNISVIFSLEYSLQTEYGVLEIIYPLLILCLLLIISSFILGRYLVGKVGEPLEILIDQIGDINTVQIDKSKLRIKMDDEIGMLIDSFNSMKIKISDYMAKLQIQNERLETLFDNIAYSIIIIDQNFSVETMNNRGGCFAGSTKNLDDEHGKCYNLFPNIDQPFLKCPFYNNKYNFESE